MLRPLLGSPHPGSFRASSFAPGLCSGVSPQRAFPEPHPGWPTGLRPHLLSAKPEFTVSVAPTTCRAALARARACSLTAVSLPEWPAAGGRAPAHRARPAPHSASAPTGSTHPCLVTVQDRRRPREGRALRLCRSPRLESHGPVW